MDKQPIGTEKLPAQFYLQDTVEVARQLIGKRLVHRVNGQELSAIICETEAYTGFSDKACHSYKGRTERTEVMFEAGGRAYVYLIYGMYCCFNITTREAGVPPEQIAATRRINIDYAQEARDFLYRFVDTKSPCLSQKWKGETR